MRRRRRARPPRPCRRRPAGCTAVTIERSIGTASALVRAGQALHDRAVGGDEDVAAADPDEQFGADGYRPGVSNLRRSSTLFTTSVGTSTVRMAARRRRTSPGAGRRRSGRRRWRSPNASRSASLPMIRSSSRRRGGGRERWVVRDLEPELEQGCRRTVVAAPWSRVPRSRVRCRGSRCRGVGVDGCGHRPARCVRDRRRRNGSTRSSEARSPVRR